MTLLENLAGYWRLDDDSVPARGSIIGSDLNVVYSPESGKINDGAGFAGDGHIRLSDVLAFRSPDFSVSMWFKTDVTQNAALFSMYDGTGGERGWRICVEAFSGIFTFNAYDADGSLHRTLLTTPYNDGSWHHVVCVYDGSDTGTLNIYVDGVLQTFYIGTIPAIAYHDAHFPSIGSSQYAEFSEFYYYTGAIDEVGFWTRALDGGDVALLYNGGDGLSFPFGLSFSPSHSPSSSASPSESPSESPSPSPSESPSLSPSPAPSGWRWENVAGKEVNWDDHKTIYAEELNQILDRLHALDGQEPTF